MCRFRKGFSISFSRDSQSIRRILSNIPVLENGSNLQWIEVFQYFSKILDLDFKNSSNSTCFCKKNTIIASSAAKKLGLHLPGTHQNSFGSKKMQWIFFGGEKPVIPFPNPQLWHVRTTCPDWRSAADHRWDDHPRNGGLHRGGPGATRSASATLRHGSNA